MFFVVVNFVQIQFTTLLVYCCILFQEDPDISEFALDGLRQVMSVKSRVVLPYLVPQVRIPCCAIFSSRENWFTCQTSPGPQVTIISHVVLHLVPR